MQPDSPHAQFWDWFESNGARLRASVYGEDEAARNEAYDELRDASEEAEPGLILEFGSASEDEPYLLVVSADGKPELVDAVKDFVASAPDLAGWEVVAFRPRMPDPEGNIIVQDPESTAGGGEDVGTDDIWFRVEEGDHGLDLTLHVRGLTKANEKMRGLGASLLAEHAIGERDALTLLNSLEIEPLPDAPAGQGLRPFLEMVGVLDTAKAERYPPPGQLPIDSESDWQNMQGVIDDYPVSVLLNAGLRPLAGHPDYDQRLTVTIPFEGRDDGMPANAEEYAAVTELDEQLNNTLQEEQECLLAMTLMTQGRRDMIFYTANVEAALDRLDALQAETSRRFECQVERDTYWQMYRSFCQSGEEGEDAEADEDAE